MKPNNALLLNLGVGVLTVTAILYSAIVILAALQGFFPHSCEVTPICSVLEIRVPTDRIGMLILMGVNCAMLGNLWWMITWAAGKAALGGNDGTRMRQFQVAANGARWIFWATSGATLLLPLIVVIAWLALHLLGFFVGIPILIYKHWGI